MDQVQRYQLSKTSVDHLDFLSLLVDIGVLESNEAAELFGEGCKGLPKDAREILLPMGRGLYDVLTDTLGNGYRKITMCRDGSGKRYLEAEL